MFRDEEIAPCIILFTSGIWTILQQEIAKYRKAPTPTMTGQWVVCRGRNGLEPLDVVFNPFLGAEFNEIDDHSFQHFSDYLKVVKLISRFIFSYCRWYCGIDVYDDPEEDVKNKIQNFTMNISAISLGQEEDIALHQHRYQKLKELHPNHRVCLYGISRGAATAFIDAANCRDAKLVILEGCFYSIDDVVSRSPFAFATKFINSALSFFTRYKQKGPSPNQYIENFPADIPVVFITSEIDNVVPCGSTERLANELNNRGKNPVYLLKLKSSRHPFYMFDNEKDHKDYEELVNAVYKKYGFRYIDKLATAGEPLLETCLLKPKVTPEVKTQPRI